MGATAARRLSRFLLKPVVSRVNLRDIIRTCRLIRSTWDVQTLDSSGFPEMTRFSVAIICGGLYRRSLSNPSPEYDLMSMP